MCKKIEVELVSTLLTKDRLEWCQYSIISGTGGHGTNGFGKTFQQLLILKITIRLKISVLSFVSQCSHFEMQIASIRLLTASLHQAIRSTGYAAPFISQCDRL